MSTELATTGEITPEVAAIIAQQEQDMGELSLQVPILKLCQALTKEVASGDAEAGEFLNTLTGESYGTKVDFVVAYFQRGRSASHKDGRYFVAINQETIPESWADVVGEEWVGRRFDEYPDAEEQYKKRADAKEIEWGKGPQISTTYNYTGLVVNEDLPEPMPVRITFLRSSVPAHRKILTLKNSTMRNRPFWDSVFELESAAQSFGRNDAFVVKVKKTRDTDAAEKSLAAEIAIAVTGGHVGDNAEVAEAGQASEPEAKGGLAV